MKRITLHFLPGYAPTNPDELVWSPSSVRHGPTSFAEGGDTGDRIEAELAKIQQMPRLAHSSKPRPSPIYYRLLSNSSTGSVRRYAARSCVQPGYDYRRRFSYRSQRGTQFRQWATARLKEYCSIVLDDERLNPPGPGAGIISTSCSSIRDIQQRSGCISRYAISCAGRRLPARGMPKP